MKRRLRRWIAPWGRFVRACIAAGLSCSPSSKCCGNPRAGTCERRRDEPVEGSAAMNCSQFGEVAHDVDRAGALAGPLWVEAIGHADECPSCSSLLDHVRTLNAALRELAEQDRGALASAQAEAALRTIFRQRRALRVHARAWRRWIWAGAAAVIVATALAVLTLRPGAKSATPVAAHAPAQTNSPAIQPPTATP